MLRDPGCNEFRLRKSFSWIRRRLGSLGVVVRVGWIGRGRSPQFYIKL